MRYPQPCVDFAPGVLALRGSDDSDDNDDEINIDENDDRDRASHRSLNYSLSGGSVPGRVSSSRSANVSGDMRSHEESDNSVATSVASSQASSRITTSHRSRKLHPWEKLNGFDSLLENRRKESSLRRPWCGDTTLMALEADDSEGSKSVIDAASPPNRIVHYSSHVRSATKAYIGDLDSLELSTHSTQSRTRYSSFETRQELRALKSSGFSFLNRIEAISHSNRSSAAQGDKSPITASAVLSSLMGLVGTDHSYDVNTPRKAPTLSSLFRLEEEEVTEEFSLHKIRQGIEQARQSKKPKQQTNYDVDVPQGLSIDLQPEVKGQGLKSTTRSWRKPNSGQQLDDFSDSDTCSSARSLEKLDRLTNSKVMGRYSAFGGYSPQESFASSEFHQEDEEASFNKSQEIREAEEQLENLDHAGAVIDSFNSLLAGSKPKVRKVEYREIDKLPALSSFGRSSSSMEHNSDPNANLAMKVFISDMMSYVENDLHPMTGASLTDLFKWSEKDNVDRAERSKQRNDNHTENDENAARASRADFLFGLKKYSKPTVAVPEVEVEYNSTDGDVARYPVNATSTEPSEFNPYPALHAAGNLSTAQHVVKDDELDSKIVEKIPLKIAVPRTEKSIAAQSPGLNHDDVTLGEQLGNISEHDSSKSDTQITFSAPEEDFASTSAVPTNSIPAVASKDNELIVPTFETEEATELEEHKGTSTREHPLVSDAENSAMQSTKEVVSVGTGSKLSESVTVSSESRETTIVARNLTGASKSIGRHEIDYKTADQNAAVARFNEVDQLCEHPRDAVGPEVVMSVAMMPLLNGPNLGVSYSTQEVLPDKSPVLILEESRIEDPKSSARDLSEQRSPENKKSVNPGCSTCGEGSTLRKASSRKSKKPKREANGKKRLGQSESGSVVSTGSDSNWHALDNSGHPTLACVEGSKRVVGSDSWKSQSDLMTSNPRRREESSEGISNEVKLRRSKDTLETTPQIVIPTSLPQSHRSSRFGRTESDNIGAEPVSAQARGNSYLPSSQATALAEQGNPAQGANSSSFRGCDIDEIEIEPVDPFEGLAISPEEVLAALMNASISCKSKDDPPKVSTSQVNSHASSRSKQLKETKVASRKHREFQSFATNRPSRRGSASARCLSKADKIGRSAKADFRSVRDINFSHVAQRSRNASSDDDSIEITTPTFRKAPSRRSIYDQGVTSVAPESAIDDARKSPTCMISPKSNDANRSVENVRRKDLHNLKHASVASPSEAMSGRKGKHSSNLRKKNSNIKGADDTWIQAQPRSNQRHADRKLDAAVSVDRRSRRSLSPKATPKVTSRLKGNLNAEDKNLRHPQRSSHGNKVFSEYSA